MKNENSLEDLVRELKESPLIDGLEFHSNYEQIANFILERDKNIVAPLVNAVNKSHCSWDRMDMAIIKTLKLAGVK